MANGWGFSPFFSNNNPILDYWLLCQKLLIPNFCKQNSEYSFRQWAAAAASSISLLFFVSTAAQHYF